MDDLRQVFERFDEDDSGTIEFDELESLLDELGLDTSGDDAVLKALSRLETTDPHRITWSELSTWWNDVAADLEGASSPLHDNEALKRLFDRFDADGSGQIDRRELSDLLQTAGLAPNDQEVVAALQQFDDDHDGQMSWDEFLEWWTELRS